MQILEGPDGSPVTAKGDADGILRVKIDGGGVGGGDASLAEQQVQSALLTDLAAAADAPTSDVIAAIETRLPATLGAGGGLKVDGSGTPLPVLHSVATPSSSLAAFESGRVLKASAGTFISLYVELDPSLASGTYYAQLLTGSASVPADGAVTHLRSPQAMIHVTGQKTIAQFNDSPHGIAFSTGCTACVSSTRFTKTAVASAAIFDGSVL